MTMKKNTAAAALLMLLMLLLPLTGGLADKSVLLTFTGDCTLGSEEIKRNQSTSFDSFIKNYGYDFCFANFNVMFESDDLTVVNLEGVLSDSPYEENKKKTFRFRGPTEFVKILTGSSIEAAGLANNHIMDFGRQGEKNTRETLEANGVAWFRNSTPYLFDHDGITIAFFAFDNTTYFSLRSKLGGIFRDLREKEGVDAIVVCSHTGMEYRPKHEDTTAEMARVLITNGADLVIMHHPHVLQGVDIINRRNVFYSMGNFVFGGNCEIKSKGVATSLYTMVVQVKMTFTNDGEYLGQQATIYPALISSDPSVNYYQPLRVSAEDAGPVVEAIQRDTAFDLPAVTEKDGLSLIEFAYLPATDEARIPEEE